MKQVLHIGLRSIALVTTISTLSACAAAAVGGGAVGGVAVAQTRSVGHAVDDATIHTKISSSYIQKEVNKLFARVSVQVYEGRVLLTGSVPNPDDRVEAVRLAWQPQGVVEVINEIQVENPTTSKQDAIDAWITTQVKGKLLITKDINSVNFNVETVNSVVYIIGIAQNQQELNRVNNVASRIKGVQRVVNHVRLADDPLRKPY